MLSKAIIKIDENQKNNDMFVVFVKIIFAKWVFNFNSTILNRLLLIFFGVI